MSKKAVKMVKCCFCGTKVPQEESCNPAPVIEGNKRCCDECNWEVVIPYRLFSMQIRKEAEAWLQMKRA